MGYIIQRSTTIAGRTYPDGTAIPDLLPGKYRIGERCDNCAAYVPETRYCKTFDAVVRPEYVCAVWKPIQKA